MRVYTYKNRNTEKGKKISNGSSNHSDKNGPGKTDLLVDKNQKMNFWVLPLTDSHCKMLYCTQAPINIRLKVHQTQN